jgi:hypothetical protein
MPPYLKRNKFAEAFKVKLLPEELNGLNHLAQAVAGNG